MPAEVSHDPHETPQAHSPGAQRPEPLPNKTLAVKPQDATDRGAGGKQQIMAEEKPRSRSPIADIHRRIEPQEERLPRESMPGPRETIMQEICPQDSTRMRAQTAGMETDARSKLKQNNGHHVHRNILEPRQSNGTQFPSSFDKALEDLLKTCNASLNRSKDPMATSIGDEPLNRTQSRGSLLGISARGQNAGVTDQTKPFTSDKAYPNGQAFNSGSGPRSSTLETSFANAKVKPNLPQPENARNPPSNPTPEESKIQTPLPNRTWLGDEPTALHSSLGWHQNEQKHDHTSVGAGQGSIPSGAWHGYQALYENQVFPDDEADVNEHYVLDPEVQGRQDEQQWFQHHAADADGAESGFPFEDTQDDLLYAQRGPEDGYTDAHDWELTSHPPFAESGEHQPLNDNDIDFDMRYRHIPRFSDSGYGRSTITSRQGPHRPTSALGRPDDNSLSEARGMDTPCAPNVYHERISHRWRPAQIDDNETYLADFWRPNRLY